MDLINPWLSLLGLVLPLVVAAVTKSRASSALKGWSLAVLSALAAVIAELIETGIESFDTREALNNLLLIFVSSVVAYKGGLVKQPAQAIRDSTATIGVGSVPARRHH